MVYLSSNHFAPSTSYWAHNAMYFTTSSLTEGWPQLFRAVYIDFAIVARHCYILCGQVVCQAQSTAEDRRIPAPTCCGNGPHTAANHHNMAGRAADRGVRCRRRAGWESRIPKVQHHGRPKQQTKNDLHSIPAMTTVSEIWT